MDFRGKRIFFNIVGAVLALLLCVGGFFALVLGVCNVLLVKTNVYQFSMFPTLNAGVSNIEDKGDTVYINKFANLQRGNIVVARVNWNAKPIIKRLVAMPYDEIYIEKQAESYTLFVNEQPFYSKPATDESFHPQDGGTNKYYNYIYLPFVNNAENIASGRVINKNGKNIIKLFKDEYFLIGDNWADSADSMLHGAVSKNNIIGSVQIVIPVGQNVKTNLLKQIFKLVFSF